jgi:hypothetical protein
VYPRLNMNRLNMKGSPSDSPPPATRWDPHQQLQWALQPRSMALFLGQALGLQPLDSDEAIDGDGERWKRCHILDMKYRPGEFCTILYQLDEHLLIGLLAWGEMQPKRPANAQVVEPVGMQLYRFEQDPALPGLATALDAKLIAELLAKHMGGNARILRCRVTPLRYRPGKRCTLRLELWLRDAKSGVISSATLFGKLYHDQFKAQSVYAEMQMLSTAMPVEGSPLVLARAAGFLPELALVLQAPVAGTPLDLLLSHPERTRLTSSLRASEGIGRAAAALAALHQIAVPSRRERAVGAELSKLKARAAQVATVDSTLGARLTELIAALLGSLHQLSAWNAEMSLVHGDCKPSQFLIGPLHAALIDFDHCAIADPASDVGAFLATLRQMKVSAQCRSLPAPMSRQESRLPRSLVSWCHALEERFLEEYISARGCHPDLRRRATWYMALALLRKSLRSFARSPRSPLPALLVEEAWRCLALL